MEGLWECVEKKEDLFFGVVFPGVGEEGRCSSGLRPHSQHGLAPGIEGILNKDAELLEIYPHDGNIPREFLHALCKLCQWRR